MGRIFDQLRVNHHSLYVLFDSGSRNSYVRASAADVGTVAHFKHPFLTEIGGSKHRIRETCALQGTLRGKLVTLTAYVLPEIGDDGTGRAIDVIFGAHAMQDFGIRLIPESEEVDLTHYHRELYEV